jgi:hydroxymethylbilane synthase
MTKLIIGSRGSKLALWQANWVKDRLEKTHSGLQVEIEIIKTTGDKLTEASLVKIGGKGVFTKEIEDALIERRVDLAVHSLKDLPTELPEGLHIAAITEREDVRDGLIVSETLRGKVKKIADLPEKARVGTSSLRRRSQLLASRPDLQILELRGNVDTRLRKLDEGEYDAIILAAAGLIRLGYGDRITMRIESTEMLSAVGQGALGIETRIDDERTNTLLKPLNHWPTRHATEAERALLRCLGGGCAVPIAALGRVSKDKSKNKKPGKLELDALVADADGKKKIRHKLSGPLTQAEDLGARLAQVLIDSGARELLPRIGEEEVRSSESGVRSQEDAEVRSSESEVRSQEDAEVRSSESEVRSQGMVAGISGVSNSEISNRKSSLDSGLRTPNSELPLSGRRVIVTRSVKQGRDIIEELQSLGAEVIACPTIEIKDPTNWEQLDRALKHLSWYDWLAFTSANGVEYFLQRLDGLGHGRAELMAHKVCAVGRKTAEKLMEEQIAVDLTPERFTADALVEEFIKRFGVRQRLRGARMLLPASSTTRDVIRPALEKVGVYVEVVEAYQTVPPETSGAEVTQLIRGSNADFIIFTSPSTVTNLAALLETDHLAPQLAKTRVACIGPITAETARAYGLEVHIQPDVHTSEEIVKALVAESTK